VTKILIEAQIGGDALRCSKMISYYYIVCMFGGCGKPTFPLCWVLYWGWAHHIKGCGVLEHMNEFLLKLSTSIITR